MKKLLFVLFIVISIAPMALCDETIRINNVIGEEKWGEETLDNRFYDIVLTITNKAYNGYIEPWKSGEPKMVVVVYDHESQIEQYQNAFINFDYITTFDANGCLPGSTISFGRIKTYDNTDSWIIFIRNNNDMEDCMDFLGLAVYNTSDQKNDYKKLNDFINKSVETLIPY